MNLRLAKGKVPIRGRGDTPFLMVAFPDRELFNKLYAGINDNNKDKYWAILNCLRSGATMQEAGKPFALTRERVRQIEAKFIRLVGGAYWTQVDTDVGLTTHFSQDTFLMLEKQGTSLPFDESR